LDLITLLRKEMSQQPQLLAPFGFKITEQALVEAVPREKYVETQAAGFQPNAT